MAGEWIKLRETALLRVRGVPRIKLRGKRSFPRTSKRVPFALLPRIAATHRAARQHVAHGYAVPALRAAELSGCTPAALPERDELVGSDIRQSRLPHDLAPLVGRPHRRRAGPFLPILRPVQTPDPYVPPDAAEDDWLEPAPRPVRPIGAIWAWGGVLTWLSGLILAISAFTDW